MRINKPFGVIYLDKISLRREILGKKTVLDNNTIAEYSKKIITSLMNMDYYKNANKIMTYISFGTEVDTHEFIKESLKLNKEIYVPITNPDKHKIKPSQILGFNELELGFYNILTPKKEAIRYVDPKEIDLVIVPGVVFDRKGYRIGYGGGYYDRFLPLLNANVPKISLAFDLQLINRVPRDYYDIPVDIIITEVDIIIC